MGGGGGRGVSVGKTTGVEVSVGGAVCVGDCVGRRVEVAEGGAAFVGVTVAVRVISVTVAEGAAVADGAEGV